MKKKIYIFAALSLVLICCSPLVFKPTIQDVEFSNTKWAGTTSAHLEKGYSLYIGKCGGCHYLHKPTEYTEKRWLEILPDMKDKAKIDSSEYVLILRYVITKSYTMAAPK